MAAPTIKFCAVLLLFIGLQTFIPAASAIYESTINATITNFTKIIATGDAALGIPILDPFRLANFELEHNGEILTYNAQLEDVLIIGLSSLVVSNLKIGLIPPKMNIELTIPKLKAIGHYILDAQAAGILGISRKGEFNIMIEDLKLSGSATISLTNLQEPRISNLNLGVGAGTFSAYFSGFEDTQTFLKPLFSALSSDVFDNVKISVKNVLLDSLTKYINGNIGGAPSAAVNVGVIEQPQPELEVEIEKEE